MKLGRNLARTFLDYYKLQNHIVFNPSAVIMPKLNTNANYIKNTTSLLNPNPSQNSLSSSLNVDQSSTKSNKTKRSSSNLATHPPLKPIPSPNLVQHSNSSMSNASGGSQSQNEPKTTENSNANNNNTNY